MCSAFHPQKTRVVPVYENVMQWRKSGNMQLYKKLALELLEMHWCVRAATDSASSQH